MCSHVDTWIKHGLRAVILISVMIGLAVIVGGLMAGHAVYCSVHALICSSHELTDCLRYWQRAGAVLAGALVAISVTSFVMDWLLKGNQH